MSVSYPTFCTNIRKVYKNGITDSVMDNYRRYLEK